MKPDMTLTAPRPATVGRSRVVLAALVAMAVLALMMSAFLPGAVRAQQPHDNRGNVKIHDGAGEPSPIVRNQPKVCDFLSLIHI